MHNPLSRGFRGGRRGHPHPGWRGPPGTQIPLPQIRATALPSPLSSRPCLRLLAGGRVRLGGRRLVSPMQTGWCNNLLLALEVILANTTMLASCSAPALLTPTGTTLVQERCACNSMLVNCSSAFVACSSQIFCSLRCACLLAFYTLLCMQPVHALFAMCSVL